MKTLRQQYQAVLDRAAELAKTASDEAREFSAEEVAEITELRKQETELGEQVNAAVKAANDIAEITAKTTQEVPEQRQSGPGEEKTRTFGDRFTKSNEYQAFKHEHESGIGQGTPINIGRVKVGTMDDWFSRRKATLTTEISHPATIRFPTVDLVDRDRLTLLDLISRGQTAGNFEYVQIVGVTRNAAIVPEATSGTDAAALKPLSDMQTAIADAKVYTYADGYDVTNQLLSDAPAFASYMNNELQYSLDNVVEEKLLNGSGTSGEPRGLLNTTGVQHQDIPAAATGEQEFMPFVKSVRRAITKVTRLPGGTVTGVLMSPEDDEAWDLLQDKNDRFYGQGPFGSGPPTAWGRPRVTSERLKPGTFILGDFKQIALLDREGLSVLAFNQHKDYAQRNMTYVRAELRAAQAIWKPNRLVVGKAAAPSGGGA